LLFNNRIYGLTKGQYSPTSPKGFITKSSPFGSIERAFSPAELTFGAGGTFFARAIDIDSDTLQKVMIQAHNQKGTSVIECLVNCVIFNNGTHSEISSKELRSQRTIVLEHGKPMIFGTNKDKGLLLDGLNLKAVEIGKNGITESDILIHDAKTSDYTLHLKLAQMKYPEMPVAMGVIRNVNEPTYETEVENQISEVKAKSKIKNFDDLINSLEQWDI
jgi:2-oxoglutarate ferredoxin oxidoreductase subunit beta